MKNGGKQDVELKLSFLIERKYILIEPAVPINLKIVNSMRQLMKYFTLYGYKS